MYILTRQDLKPAQRAVQACHAVAELMLRNRDCPALLEWAKDHKTMVLLGVESEADLLSWEGKLAAEGIPTAIFREPDMGNQATALAVHPSCDKNTFKKLPLCS